MDNSMQGKMPVLGKLAEINAVEGFDPSIYLRQYTDPATQETYTGLPAMVQIAWFRLKYPEGRLLVRVKIENNCYVAQARVYKHYQDPEENYLAEATASRTHIPDKPNISPREWAQTAALGIALRNAGFGIYLNTDDDLGPQAANELETAVNGIQNVESPVAGIQPQIDTPVQEPQETPLERAMKVPCVIAKYQGRTLGELITLDPKSLIWTAKKYEGDPTVSAAARLICEHALNIAV